MVTVIVPAHNERKVIGRLLKAITTPSGAGSELDVVVVCNGCSDDTAEVAGAFPGVRVVSTSTAGKANALRLGDAEATSFPRVYVDADVEVDVGDLAALCRALDDPEVLVAAPRRVIPLEGVPLSVRLYYRVWEELPSVRSGVFGRGVIAVSERGHERIAGLPPVMADDLAFSSVFRPGEKRVVDEAVVVVHPPASWSDLLRRRVRAVTGTHQVYAGGAVPAVADSRTSLSDLFQVLRRKPATVWGMPVFLVAAVLARRRAAKAIREGDFSTWLRDESSREVIPER